MSDEARITSGWSPPVERLCGDFEAAWKAGRQPAIEDYLRDAPPAARTTLLRELLRLDLAYRGGRQPKPTLEEYRLRFPEEIALIRAVFRDTPTVADQTPPPPHERAADWPAIPGYEILDKLAPGGMGVLYRARQIGLNRMVALKMIRSGLHAGAQERARFRVEAEAVASLSHPHIIPIYDYGEWNGMPYLVMEFAEGGSLAQWLVGRPMLSAQAAELVEKLARTVQFIHDRGIIHRDLKPANVLLSFSREPPASATSALAGGSRLNEMTPKLADFGLAKRLDHDQRLTRTQTVLGTASYMAPEQAAGDMQAVGPGADVYALGAILYELLTGQPPFRAETLERTIHQVLSDDPPPPTQLRPDVPAELEAICLKCLEKAPGRRFGSALDLAEDLRRYRAGEPTSTQPLDTFAWHARSARRAGYELLEVLGTGGRSVLYKAQHLALKRTVALQMIADRRRLEPAELDRLRSETEAAAQLHHANIVEVYDFGEQNGEPYLAMEYVEGSTLADRLAGPLPPAEQAAALVETLARAVHHAHERGRVHGGLMPARVRLRADGSCKVLGFGLAHFWGDEPTLARYRAPEQAAVHGGSVGPAADVYALGAMLHELLTGRPPSEGEPVQPGRRKPHGLEAVCRKCLEREPAGRYPSAAALAEDLRRFRSGEVLFIDDLDDWPQQERWARRAGYEILEVLGRSPDGFSYKARQLTLDRVVVLKRLAAEDRFAPGIKTRFRREAYRLAALRHPNVVQLYDQGEQNDLAYFAREFVDGPSLAEQAAEAPLPFRLAAELVESLARAVQAAHTQGAIHGGLTPGDIRLTPLGVPKLTRFRPARLPRGEVEEAVSAAEWRRQASYLAPEQLARGNRGLAPTTDIYALGAILYTLLTGQPPFLGTTLAEILEQVRSQAPQPPRHRQPDLPVELEALCLKCLAEQPARRPTSAEALADELEQILARTE